MRGDTAEIILLQIH